MGAVKAGVLGEPLFLFIERARGSGSTAVVVGSRTAPKSNGPAPRRHLQTPLLDASSRLENRVLAMPLPPEYYAGCAANLEATARCLRPDIKRGYLQLAHTYREMAVHAEAIKNKAAELERTGQSTFSFAGGDGGGQ